MQTPTQADIAPRAYFIWLNAGRVHGHDQQHWAQAERELTYVPFAKRPQAFAIPPRDPIVVQAPAPRTEEVDCSLCGGRGRHWITGTQDQWMRCDECRGSGVAPVEAPAKPKRQRAASKATAPVATRKSPAPRRKAVTP